MAEIDGGGNQSYYTGDFHGTVQASFTVSGQLEDSYDYDVFGSPLEASIETDRRGYVGKPFDPLTGLYNYGYRDYRPELGRFTTVDPIRDGMNWYVYTGNDPVNYIDAWGLATEDGAAPDGSEELYGTSGGGSTPATETTPNQQYLETQQNLLGGDYVWAGNDPAVDGGTDCSGSVLYGIGQMGYNVPDQNANDIHDNLTVDIGGQDNLQAGDLIFYDWDNDERMDHVVTYDGTNRIDPSGDRDNTRDNPGKIVTSPGVGDKGHYRRIDWDNLPR